MNETIHLNTQGTVLVTGANGLVGLHLVKHLVERGYFVKAVYRSKIPAFTHMNIQWIQGDILDIEFLLKGLQNVKDVYHCAAVVSFNPKRVKEIMEINVNGTQNVVNACLISGTRKLCYVSSVATLKKSSEGKFINEELDFSTTSWESNYAKSKYLAELEVWRGIGEGQNAVIVNPSIILGKGDWTVGSSKIFQYAYDEFPWYSAGAGGFVDVQDVVAAMVMLTESDASGERFILNAENISFKSLFTTVAILFNKRPPIKKASLAISKWLAKIELIRAFLNNSEPFLTNETINTAQNSVTYDNSKIIASLPAFKFRSIRESLKDIADYYLSSLRN